MNNEDYAQLCLFWEITVKLVDKTKNVCMISKYIGAILVDAWLVIIKNGHFLQSLIGKQKVSKDAKSVQSEEQERDKFDRSIISSAS